VQLSFRRFISAVVILLVACFAGDALAEEKRPPQDYGRPPEATTIGDVLAWPVRVVLFPFYLINEFILRRPIGWIVVTVEKNRVLETVQDFFTFGPRNEVTIYPSALFDFGLLPSVGFNLKWEHFLAEDNTLRVHFGTWGPTWINGKASTTYDFSKKEHLTFTAEFVRRRDNPFFGLGPKSETHDWTRYGAQTFNIAPTYQRDLWRASKISLTSGFRGTDFFHGTCCGDPSLDFALVDNRLPIPPGYQRSYYGGYQRSSAALDTRRARPEPGSGIRVEGHEETMFDLSDHPGEARRSWIKYGGSVGGALDLTGHQRILALTARAELADPLHNPGGLQGQVPFTDLATLGGDDVMPGFIRNRMIDRSSAAATLQYTWPVWMYLDGILTGSMGNVWGEHLHNFKVQDSRLSAGVGVRSNGDRDSGFELLVGAGTEPISEGMGLTSFRLLVGSHHGL
jgi:hypothetical protein